VRLDALLRQTSVTSVHGSREIEISGLCADSGQVIPGVVFVALQGMRQRGGDFIQEAVARGASVVVAEPGEPFIEKNGVTRVVVTDARRALAELACAYYERPSEKLRIAGVTGTNGKTTTTFLLQHICDTALQRCGLIGTVRYQVGGSVLPAARTTPDALELQGLLAQMRDAGCRTVAMEVSSHAVTQQRVRGVEFDAVVFTNLTQDHLDYHGTMEAYYETKAGLVLGLGAQRFKPGVAVLNIDDRHGALLHGRALQAGVPVLAYGQGQKADFRASNCRTDVQGSSFQLDAVGRSFLVRLPLSGMFNISNALGALAAAHALGVDVRTAVLALASAPPVPGRLEPVAAKRAFRVFVDYAHTEDALRTVLRTLRDLQPSHLVTVFGCGGDRDKGKRPLMGAAAEEYSDWTIVTSDNPRSESPEQIAAEITRGMSRGKHEVVLDRRAAIQRAIGMAGPRAIVLIAGKGHETTQEIAGKTEPFDDVAIARSALENLESDFGR
jgi:UDP-N-acetylmuramoyl-L-alanyl-D-glutamate--2,6-diaminopimelate ligase